MKKPIFTDFLSVFVFFRIECIFAAMKKIEITNTEQLEHLISDSFDKRVLLFKHSTRCGISRMALKNFEFDLGEETYYYLDLISFRSISNEIAEKFQVKHESPQLLYIENGEVVKVQNHHQISI